MLMDHRSSEDMRRQISVLAALLKGSQLGYAQCIIILRRSADSQVRHGTDMKCVQVAIRVRLCALKSRPAATALLDSSRFKSEDEAHAEKARHRKALRSKAFLTLCSIDESKGRRHQRLMHEPCSSQRTSLRACFGH